MPDSPRIVFFGTPDFAVPSLEILLQNKYPVVGVVTAPDKPAGRGLKTIPPPVKDIALKHQLPLLQPEKLKDPDFIRQLQELKADLFIVVAFRMLPDAVWKMPRSGTFNLHASLLPQYRGAAPINWAIINGDQETGLTTFFIRHEIDTGQIIFQDKTEIKPDETAGDLHDRLKELGAKLVLETVEAIANKAVTLLDQEKISGAGELKPAPKLNRENTALDLHRTVFEISDKIRGLSPYPALHGEFFHPVGGVSFVVKIFKAAATELQHDKKPGTLETDNKSYLKFYARKGILDILELQLAGRNRVSVRDFLNGFKFEGDWVIR